MLIEVPAHVQQEHHVQNAVQVKGGTNWDLSRSAVATPISALPDPQPERITPSDSSSAWRSTYLPQHRMPEHAPNVVVRFGKGAAIVSGSAQRDLKGLRKGAHVIVAGHSDSREKSASDLAQRRAEAVARQLRKQGVSVDAVRHFGGSLPVTDAITRASDNRRVEVFVQ